MSSLLQWEWRVVSASQDSRNVYWTLRDTLSQLLTSAPVVSLIRYYSTSSQTGRLLPFPSTSPLCSLGSVHIIKMKEGFVDIVGGRKGQLGPCFFIVPSGFLSFSHPVIIYMHSRYQSTVTTIYQVLASLPPGSADRVSAPHFCRSSVCSHPLSPSL